MLCDFKNKSKSMKFWEKEIELKIYNKNPTEVHKKENRNKETDKNAKDYA